MGTSQVSFRESHGKQTLQKSLEIKGEFHDHKQKVQRAQWKADFVFVFVSGAGRELIRVWGGAHKV